MLKALYDYATRNGLTLPPGFTKKTVKAYILLYEDGTFQDVELSDGTEVIAPDIGSLANGTDKSNVLMEKRSIVIPEADSAKHDFFIRALRDAAESETKLAFCAAVLENPETAAVIRRRLDEKKVKDSDRVTFKVGFRSILEEESVKAWWSEYRRQFLSVPKGDKPPCLVTGEPIVPMRTTPVISGLLTVGGHPSGDALTCFDKDAFCSYGLDRGANAPVSEETYAAVKAALEALIRRAPILAGMKFVHWYDCEVPRAEDPLCSGDFEDVDVELEEGEWEENESDEATEYDAEEERNAIQQADKLVCSVQTGEEAYLAKTTHYYILMLSGASGRIMIRRYERGDYSELRARLASWHEDLRLVNGTSSNFIKPCKLTARLLKLLKYQKTDKKPGERLGKELAGIAPAILDAILSGGSMPDAVAARALAFIRSEMLSTDDENANALFTRDAAVWQWLKVWLLRNRGKRGILMEMYNPNYVSDSNAYHCGAMMALYEAIQNAAMPDVNAGVAQRFYASAIQTPALVLGRLSQMSVHHLEKMENRWLADRLKKRLSETASHIQGRIPTTLSLEGQSEFALGYYQMHAQLEKEKNEQIAAKKQEQKED